MPSKKLMPRDEEELRALKSRIHRIQGQLNGIETMLDEQRYCQDILIQVAAVTKAMRSLGSKILESHLKSCVVERVKKDEIEVMDEVMDLISKLG